MFVLKAQTIRVKVVFILEIAAFHALFVARSIFGIAINFLNRCTVYGAGRKLTDIVVKILFLRDAPIFRTFGLWITRSSCSCNRPQ